MKKTMKQKLEEKGKEFISNPNERKKTVTLFMIIIFSLLIAMTSYMDSWLMRLWFQVILFFAQLIIVWTILEDYYSR
jgi:hypothetical protein